MLFFRRKKQEKYTNIPEDKLLYNIKEVSMITGISVGQVRMMIREKTLPMWQVNNKGKWYITSDSLRKCINDFEHQTT
jgi:hypothetical protein